MNSFSSCMDSLRLRMSAPEAMIIIEEIAQTAEIESPIIAVIFPARMFLYDPKVNKSGFSLYVRSALTDSTIEIMPSAMPITPQQQQKATIEMIPIASIPPEFGSFCCMKFGWFDCAWGSGFGGGFSDEPLVVVVSN